MNKARKSISVLVGGLGVASLIGLAVTGYEIGWGPFKALFRGYENEISAIEQKYDVETRKGEIVFYGASNFRLWTEMESDLAEYKVQNHGFGGSTDKLLMQYADRALYPYEPKIVFFQTGSNDYVGISGTEEEKVEQCMAFKRDMFDTVHTVLPEAKLVVMSGLMLPGRDQYRALTERINGELRVLCEERDYLFFVDASDMTWDGINYRTDLFIKDQIHLNHEGQLLWMQRYIRPQIEQLIEDYGLSELRKSGE